MKYIIFALTNLLFVLAATPVFAQKDSLKGRITNEKNEVLSFATVQWQTTKEAVIADANGRFTIVSYPKADSLMVSFTGYNPVAVFVLPSEKRIWVEMKDAKSLGTVEIGSTRRGNFTSTINPLNVEQINSNELRKAACCNLAESFETSGAVDVSYTDAVTGAKELEMLGLRGNYTQMMSEAIPNLYGLQSAYGLEYYPGTWLSEISLAKGASTVSNGAEGIAGQISFCMKQPDEMERLFANIFTSSQGRFEVNIDGSHRFKDKKTSTALFLHHNRMLFQQDLNGDGWRDMPHREQYNAMNRWSFDFGNWKAKLLLHGITEKRIGGMLETDAQTHTSNGYNFGMNTDRVQIIGKLGYMGFEKAYQSFGSQYTLTYQNMNGNFGSQKIYNGVQKSLYINTLYETIIDNTMHKLRVGANYILNDYNELLTQNLGHHGVIKENRVKDLSRKEQVVGSFFEYNWLPNDKFSLLAGLRGDVHNLAGFQLAPRINLKYSFDENTIVRASAGRGYRLSNVVIENLNLLTSAREIRIPTALNPETAWNYGANFTHNFKIDMHEGSVNLDVYRTDFQNQIVTDLDAASQIIYIQNLNGKSFSNSVLLTASYFPIPRFEVKAAYKWTDAQTTTGGVLQQRVLQPQHRGLINLHYQTFKKDWDFNLNSHIIGEQRLPVFIKKTDSGFVDYPKENIETYRFTGVSPAYFLVNAQINKRLGNNWELYFGGENLTNYTQKNPILSANDPEGAFFDATTIFAPITGAMGYLGVKWTLK